MAKTLPQLQKQITALQRQADVLKKKEMKGVVARIREAIVFYDIKPEDLGFSRKSAAKTAKAPAGKSKAAKTASRIKFRDQAGNTWSGHGRRPRWYLDALTAGKTVEELTA